MKLCWPPVYGLWETKMDWGTAEFVLFLKEIQNILRLCFSLFQLHLFICEASSVQRDGLRQRWSAQQEEAMQSRDKDSDQESFNVPPNVKFTSVSSLEPMKNCLFNGFSKDFVTTVIIFLALV